MGGSKLIPMGELRSVIADLGFERVVTHLQSGNVVFDAPEGSLQAHVTGIRSAISDRFGFDVGVVGSTPDDLRRILAADPIPGANAEPSRYVVAFPLAPIPTERVAALDPEAYRPDEVRFAGHVVYVWYQDGIGRSRLTSAILERAAGVPLTVRNWNTVTKVARLASR